MFYLGNGLYSDAGSCYLEHHGIEGQKWGVRRGPPYPIDDKVLRKGYRLHSMNTDKDSKAYQTSGKWMYTSNNDFDRHIYNGSFSTNRLARSTKNPFKRAFGNVYEHNYETTRDLKMPTKKERKDAFIKLLKSNPKYIEDLKDGAKYYQNVRKNAGYAAKRLKIGDKLDEKDYDAAFEIFNGMIGHNRDGWDITRDWSAEMSKKYDAMVDDNDVKLYSGSKDPIIIFDPEKSLRTYKPATTISARNRFNNNIAYNVQTIQNKLEQKKNPNMYHSDTIAIPSLQHDDMNDINNYLCHYGVLGMKWGVRRGKQKTNQLPIKRTSNDEIDSFVKTLMEDWGITNKKEAREIAIDELKRQRREKIKERNYVAYLETEEGQKKAFDDAKDAYSKQMLEEYLKEKGVKLYHSDTIAIPSLQHDDMNDINNYLCHYGVLGMKWGIHRAKKHERNMYYKNRANGMSRIRAKAYKKRNIKWAKEFAKANKHTDAKIEDISKHSYERAKENISNYDRKIVDQGIRNGVIVGLKPVKWYVASKNVKAALGVTAGQMALAAYGRHRTKKDMKDKKKKKDQEVAHSDTIVIPSLQHDDMNDVNNYLCHFGRKGMKWGQHIFGDEETISKKYGYSPQEANRRLTNLDKFYKKHVIRKKGWLKPWNAWADKSESFYADLNKKYTFEKPVDWDVWDNNDEQTKAYIKEAANGFKNGYRAEIDKVYGKYAKQNLPENYYEVFPGYNNFDYILSQEKKIEHSNLNLPSLIHSDAEDINNYLCHYGVKGMKWGIRNDRNGKPRNLNRQQKKISKEAEKDAIEFARAKMFYGEGAGNRRKLIKNSVEAKKKKSNFYAYEFDNYLQDQDMDVHAKKAKSERQRKDTAKSLKKGGKKAMQIADTVLRFV